MRVPPCAETACRTSAPAADSSGVPRASAAADTSTSATRVILLRSMVAWVGRWAATASPGARRTRALAAARPYWPLPPRALPSTSRRGSLFCGSYTMHAVGSLSRSAGRMGRVVRGVHCSWVKAARRGGTWWERCRVVVMFSTLFAIGTGPGRRRTRSLAGSAAWAAVPPSGWARQMRQKHDQNARGKGAALVFTGGQQRRSRRELCRQRRPAGGLRASTLHSRGGLLGWLQPAASQGQHCCGCMQSRCHGGGWRGGP